MNKGIIRGLIVAGVMAVAIPVLLIVFYIVFQVIGYYANHAATDRQTKELVNYITQEIADAQITDEYSETGNTSGTGNHVDCLSRVTFTSGKSEDDITKILNEEYDSWALESDNGTYTVELNTSAPFPDNIEGH